MNIAIVGCGYISWQYIETLRNHPGLQLSGAFDQLPERTKQVCDYYSLRQYRSLDEILDDSSVEIVLNLTNPRSHYEVSKRCLEAGRHVYSEKPLTPEIDQADALVELANDRGLLLASAPCSVLGETAQTIWQAIRKGTIGRVRLVYATYDGGMEHKDQSWRHNVNPVGIVWPAKDEFETGCTLEHAGYYLTWLVTFFGPARRMTAFSSCQFPDKEIPVDCMAPDFSIGAIEFSDGVVARVTHGIIAPWERSFTAVGDEGVLYMREWKGYASPVSLFRPAGRGRRSWKRLIQNSINQAVIEIPGMSGSITFDQSIKLARRPTFRVGKHLNGRRMQYVDRCRGVAEMADAIQNDRPCRLSAELGRHVTELTIALQHPERFGVHYIPTSTFAPPKPMPWASDEQDPIS